MAIKLAVMGTTEIEKAKVYMLADVPEYRPHAVVSKTILRKHSGNVIISSLDTGEEWSEKVNAFDTFIQIIDGSAEIIIDDEVTMLETGDGIIVPAHKRSTIKAIERFKMILTSLVH